ncbi:hypothetical protein DFP77_10959 [Marinomonas foliarum]|jgi:tetrahydromethanopterin S-methyltransferase subunit B|uniref:Uncharacterized protein n=1 Tax=Marinomonas foliarum TaxID=491950 RepID=A0A369ABW3_9GAMM|nr:hypothetical protein DFP77_10959 [Marinomonas foliarum]
MTAFNTNDDRDGAHVNGFYSNALYGVAQGA